VLATVYELRSNDLIRAIAMLLDHRDLVLQDGETVAGGLERFRAKPAPGFSACLMVESARKPDIFHWVHLTGSLPRLKEIKSSSPH